MAEFKDIFSKYGYSLFEEESLEMAIIDAIKSRNTRYILGIPVIIENAEIDFMNLLKYAKQEGLSKETVYILNITSQIIKNRKTSEIIKKLIENKEAKPIGPRYEEFKENYEKYKAMGQTGIKFKPSLNYQLSFLFAKKQIEILYKAKHREKLTKTEAEYYSRVIKKKLRAVKELREFAEELLIKN